ncbi:ABC transporter permease family protein [Dethiosulfovibrio salsuginis]|uniref:ABC transporter type 1 GsiC-like N-terminal domain-containing protein n=1 Tax=Dethiosulfovibrio salsuginis TaxID=561720 RepID=A0A1X7JQ16_9BACT|nr:hypothetical protein [Dethiosulfovibrio salsuginis]SMG30374.1 hypothetical protein SAMN06275492_1152 [Dethiosulfovibrio salsuginis]
MFRFIVKRLIQLVLVLFVVSLIVFVFTSVMGNPVYLMVRENATEAEVQAVVQYLGLDKPLPVQYGIFRELPPLIEVWASWSISLTRQVSPGSEGRPDLVSTKATLPC